MYSSFDVAKIASKKLHKELSCIMKLHLFLCSCKAIPGLHSNATFTKTPKKFLMRYSSLFHP